MLKRVLEEERKAIALDKKTFAKLKKESKNVVLIFKEEIRRLKILAEPFIGGSFAKETLLNKEGYDVDIFVRFDWRNERIGDKLKEIVYAVNKRLGYKKEEVHGSRDYFRLENKEGVSFEIVPVYKIKNPREARNVTDLSYFHVNYIRKKLKGDAIKKEVLLAKKFCAAQGVYGAESYIQGFSGYGLECLIVYYKTFVKMLKGLIKIKERIIIDSEKKYKNENAILLSLNESKLKSPIVLIDPTWKERNVLAALSKESFNKFQEAARKFLENPSREFFELKRINLDKIKRLSGEFVHIKIYTDKQAGDIAGTKMKKFSRHLKMELGRYFHILKEEFNYGEGQEADFYLDVESKKEVIKQGPPVGIKLGVIKFKEKNKNVFEKEGRLYSKEKIDFSAKEFIGKFAKDKKDRLKEMGIIGLKVIN